MDGCNIGGGPGCCNSRIDTINKLSRHIPRLLRYLRPQKVNKSNWAQWHLQINFIGFLLNCHGLLKHVWGLAFGKAASRCQSGRQGDGEQIETGTHEDDDKAMGVADMAKLMKASIQCTLPSPPQVQVNVLRTALDVEITAMHNLLGSTSAEKSVQEALRSPGLRLSAFTGGPHPETPAFEGTCSQTRNSATTGSSRSLPLFTQSRSCLCVRCRVQFLERDAEDEVCRDGPESHVCASLNW